MKNQTIGCQVQHCAYNHNETKTCGLERIQVSACSSCEGGHSAEDTKCASFRSKYR